MIDRVNHPPHYTAHPSGVECIQVTEHMNFCRGNAIKYLWRAGEKGSELEDLRKARWYIDREISRLEAAAEASNKADQAKAELHKRWLNCEIDMWGAWGYVPDGVTYQSGKHPESGQRWKNVNGRRVTRNVNDLSTEWYPSNMADRDMNDHAPFVRAEVTGR